jgi:DNA-binding GntR family transcriptional regulator
MPKAPPALPIPPPPAAPSAIHGPLAARAYEQIRNRILRGDLAIGAAVSRRQLAAELNISVPPVTEALQRLEAEGLLESRPRAGTRVRRLTRLDVEDRSVIREALESQSARLFAERATREEKAELRRMGLHMDKLYACCESEPVDRDFLFSVNTYHMGLHLRIAECARSPALREAIEKQQVLVFNWLHDTAVERRTLASDHHERLTSALATGTPEQADAAMRHHIRLGMAEVLAKLDDAPEPEASAPAAWRARRSAA